MACTPMSSCIGSPGPGWPGQINVVSCCDSRWCCQMVCQHGVVFLSIKVSRLLLSYSLMNNAWAAVTAKCVNNSLIFLLFLGPWCIRPPSAGSKSAVYLVYLNKAYRQTTPRLEGTQTKAHKESVQVSRTPSSRVNSCLRGIDPSVGLGKGMPHFEPP